jgi:hypothetical protein
MKMVFFPMQNLTVIPLYRTTLALDVNRFAVFFSFLSFIFQKFLEASPRDLRNECREERRTERD